MVITVTLTSERLMLKFSCYPGSNTTKLAEACGARWDLIRDAKAPEL
jgi:hypothetical protein